MHKLAHRKLIERHYNWPDGKQLNLGQRTLIMGILNVTPDSFSDGGQWDTPEKALRHALDMVNDGADIIDIGAESSRPGFKPIEAAEETERLLPFLRRLLPEIPVPVSVDTFKSATAAAAAEAGAHIINDIWGLQYEKEPCQMAKIAAKYNLPLIAMHNQHDTNYSEDIIAAMKKFFRHTIKIATAASITKDKLIIDPGIGFGKTATQNLFVLNRLEELNDIDGYAYPQLLGTSRKSFIGAALGLPITERTEATGATCVYGLLNGIAIVRVHDIKPIARMCHMIEAILQAE